jgi:hypothetical protein
LTFYFLLSRVTKLHRSLEFGRFRLPYLEVFECNEYQITDRNATFEVECFMCYSCVTKE